MATTFSMTQDALSTLGTRSSTESDDLGALVKKLLDAAEPLAQTMNGPAKAAFNNFKTKADGVGQTLNSALAGIVQSIDGQNKSFVAGAQESTDSITSDDGAADTSSVEAVAFMGKS